jgi:hypothetical protein
MPRDVDQDNGDSNSAKNEDDGNEDVDVDRVDDKHGDATQG